jgi:hypothetical protein
VAWSREFERHILRASLDLSLAFLGSFILYSRTTALLSSSHFVAHFMPTSLLMYMLYRFFFPVQDRYPWLDMLAIVLRAPFGQVTFRESFIGDVLTSIVRVIVPLTTSLIYILVATFSFFITGELPDSEQLWWQHHPFFKSVLVPALTLFPLWIRLVQCLRRFVETGRRWPHLGNASKYSSALVVSSIGMFRPHMRSTVVWLLGFIGSTLFQLYWDVFMDWGLLVVVKPEPSPSSSSVQAVSSSILGYRLRPNRMVRSPSAYYAIATLNLCLRFAWSLTLLPEALVADDAVSNTILAHIEPIVASLEIVRRMVWAILRVEWEHIETGGVTVVSYELDAGDMQQVLYVGIAATCYYLL